MIEFWREKLNPTEESCYARMLAEFSKGATAVECGNAEASNVQEAYLALYYDHPELFFLNSGCKVTQRQSGFGFLGMMNTASTVTVSHIYGEEDIRKCRRAIDQAKAELGRSVRPGMTDGEKAVLAAEYIVRRTTYEIHNLMNQNAAAALCYGQAQCSGISKAYQLLMDSLGLWCITVSGDARGTSGEMGPHAWNIIRIGGMYYHMDVTFMLGSNPHASRAGALWHAYLFYDDATCGQDHTWDRASVPACTDAGKIPNDRQIAGHSVVYETGEKAADHKRHTALSTLRQDLGEVLRNRRTSLSFYLDINVQTPAELQKIVSNAVTMAAQKEGIGCAVQIAVAPKSLVQLTFSY